jgi:type I restriction enzyme S subunit
LPVIVFGDHTRAVKFVDFPFVIGADGAKVLKATARYDPLFFSELLRRMPIPDLGYSRHMREIKRLRFPAPPPPLQKEFAKRATIVKSLVDIQNRHLVELETLFVSLQHRAFRGEL